MKDSHKHFLRLGALAVLLIGIVVAARYYNVQQYLTKEKLTALRSTVKICGIGGYLLFLLAFAIGEFAQLPGLVFVGASVFLYGKVEGGVLAFAGAVFALCACFVVVRLIGGKALSDVKWPWVKKVLDKLDTRPIWTVCLLRLVFLLSPWVNYVLAMTKLRFRHFLVGTAIGLAPPILIFVLIFDYIRQYFQL